jgi:hypothetical protein
MHTRPRRRDVAFAVDADGLLVRTVTFPGGRAYRHRCSPASYEAVARAVDECPADGGGGLVLEQLARDLDLPFTQANVALEFLKERGVVVTRGRRNYPAPGDAAAYEHAMCEFHALRERAPADPA